MISSATRSDFADWASPVLVKELRQGLRSRLFMSAFFITQLLMIVSVMINLAVASAFDARSEETRGFTDGLFWFLISLPLVLGMPMRGFTAIHSEIKDRTLELVLLSHLSSWRIALGKWTALVIQTLLLVCSVLPYVLLRYYLGGVNILADLQSLGLLFVFSCVLTAVTVALSPYESKILRSLFIVVLFAGFWFLLGTIMLWLTMATFYGGVPGSGRLEPWKIYVMIAIFGPAFIILCLEMAASRIAPAAENHSLRKRALGIFLIAAAALLDFTGISNQVAIFVAATLLVPLIIDALAESDAFSIPVGKRLLAHGWRGRLATWILAPGWVSATAFSLVVIASLAIVTGLQGLLGTMQGKIMIVSYAGALLLPAGLIRLLQPNTRSFLGFYITLQFFFIMLTLLVNIITHSTPEAFSSWLAPIPMSALLLNLFNDVPAPAQLNFLLLTSVTTCASVAFLALRSLTPWRDFSANLRQHSAHNG
ncbi:hypothetical protein TSACC_241 [Terrimicrobium sacchariphilum]|uniref:ABC-2 family transporter protein n=1 Tax=Terrimicrobium sacchariphilum TaxID=690879 RepID=A0A146G3M8_TERSA|nr:hypothetical protein [Terrimicrobium sacchariphilum]GAT31647.1 hypothetical protein TSACC_241 [Terrimicrobium sacchariphilum]